MDKFVRVDCVRDEVSLGISDEGFFFSLIVGVSMI